jgi:flagellar biosynthesis protein FlhB
MLDKNYISIKHNNTINLIGSTIFALIYSGALYIIVIIDYVYKYWLYDEKRKKYHVFN